MHCNKHKKSSGMNTSLEYSTHMVEIKLPYCKGYEKTIHYARFVLIHN